MSFVKRVVFPLLVFIGLTPLLCHAVQKIHTVNGGPSSRLTEAAGAISSSPGGTHIVEFAGYSDVGNFSLDNPVADTIIFRRQSTGVAAIGFSSTALFSITSFNGVVIFRGLAFKAMSKNALLLLGGASPQQNKSLVFDSCQIYGDSLTASPFLRWEGAVDSKISFRKTFVTIRSGAGNIKLQADTINFDHSVVNSSMLLTADVQKFLSLKGNTFVRTQVGSAGLPLGSSVAIATLQNNLFLLPTNGRTGPINMFAMGSIVPDSILNNGKDTRYSLWDQGQYNNVYQSGNNNGNSSAVFPDSTEAWNWVIAGEGTRGAFSPPGNQNALPTYTLFPGINTLNRVLKKPSERIL